MRSTMKITIFLISTTCLIAFANGAPKPEASEESSPSGNGVSGSTGDFTTAGAAAIVDIKAFLGVDLSVNSILWLDACSKVILSLQLVVSSIVKVAFNLYVHIELVVNLCVYIGLLFEAVLIALLKATVKISADIKAAINAVLIVVATFKSAVKLFADFFLGIKLETYVKISAYVSAIFSILLNAVISFLPGVVVAIKGTAPLSLSIIVAIGTGIFSVISLFIQAFVTLFVGVALDVSIAALVTVFLGICGGLVNNLQVIFSGVLSINASVVATAVANVTAIIRAGNPQIKQCGDAVNGIGVNANVSSVVAVINLVLSIFACCKISLITVARMSADVRSLINIAADSVLNIKVKLNVPVRADLDTSIITTLEVVGL